MGNKEFWMLSLSKMPNEEGPRIEIDSSENVPPKGEAKQILGLFKTESDAQLVRKRMKDDFLLSRWGQFLFLEYEDGNVLMVGETRMSEIFNDFCSSTH